jgi:alpha/beta superfamily hydrolase
VTDIRGGTVLPAKRTAITLVTSDGLRLVGELALPADRDPMGTLICLHPLPTQGGTMDSHLLKKASFRLPALADLAVLRFNTRGTSSERGTSEGTFGAGEDERSDVAAAISYAADAGLPGRWLLGWSFGTELALRWGLDASQGRDIEGAILLSPPLRRPTDADLDRWAAVAKPLIALVPELDDYLRPDEARRRFARVPTAEVIAVDHAKHLWVGEPYVRIVMNEIVRQVNPAALLPPDMTLPTSWEKSLFRTDLPQPPGQRFPRPPEPTPMEPASMEPASPEPGTPKPGTPKPGTLEPGSLARPGTRALVFPGEQCLPALSAYRGSVLPGDQLTGSSSMTGSSAGLAVTARRTLGRNSAAAEATATAAAPTQTAGASPETKAVPLA